MTRKLLELPPELLVHILALLSVRDLLNFSQASQQCRILANSNIHTLNLGVLLTSPFYITRRADIKRYRRIQHRLLDLASAQPPPVPPSDRDNEQLRSSNDVERRKSTQKNNDSDTIWVRINEAHMYDSRSLLRFHDALFGSILHRHGQVLQHLHLCLWTLTPSVAQSIAKLSALRTLSIKIETNQHTQPILRHCRLKERTEPDKGWNILATNAAWTHHLRALKLENADLKHSHLSALLQNTRICRELSLQNCQFIGNELWTMLHSSTWQGRATLQHLAVGQCGGLLDERALTAIGQLHGLQVSY